MNWVARNYNLCEKVKALNVRENEDKWKREEKLLIGGTLISIRKTVQITAIIENRKIKIDRH